MSSSRLVRGVARRAATVVEERTAADLVIAELLRDERAAQLADPVGFITFLRDAFEPARCSVDTLAEIDGGDLPALRFDTLVERLRNALPPLASQDAFRIGLRADELSARRAPFERPPHLAMDVGLHAGTASSFARKGRILGATVRFMRCKRALEIGTAYGMSAMYLCQELERHAGSLVTLERSHPQIDVAAEVLAAEHPDTARLISGVSTDLEADLGQARFDLLFHDAEHSREAYIRDFETFVERLDPGAVVLYDDIRWEDAHRAEPADTHAGWRAVTQHDRVRAVAEIDGLYGLLLLS